MELEDAAVDAGIEWGGVMASTAGGAYATSYALGAVAGFSYSVFVKPVLTETYKDVVKPATEWIGDKVNDVEDWWDSLWW